MPMKKEKSSEVPFLMNHTPPNGIEEKTILKILGSP
jgi:hypothetical protein